MIKYCERTTFGDGNMINKIHIENVATYKLNFPVEFGPKKINFIYGANGTGKSTLAKVLNNELTSSECNIEWDPNSDEELVVYNRDFVNKNFQADKALKGIFSLGEEAIEIRKEIEEKQKNIDDIEEEKNNFQKRLNRLEGEQISLRADIEQKCWNIQKTYGQEFADALKGFRGRAKVFCDECINRANGYNSQNVLTLEELKTMYQVAFSKNAVKADLYNKLPLSEINSLDTNQLLGTVVVGKSDTPIGAFIEYLKASDWVKVGVGLAKKVPGKCPYCQQPLPQNIQEDIEDYFDKKYEESKKKLETYEKSYSSMISDIKSVIQEIDNRRYSYIDYKEFDDKKNVLVSKLEKNQKVIQSKLQFLSEIVEIDSVVALASELDVIIQQFNEKIAKNNDIVENQKSARIECTNRVWDFLLSHCNEDITEYNKNYSGIERGKNSLLSKIGQKANEIKILKDEIEVKEASFTSVKPTVKDINEVLKGFGFTGFQLAENKDKTGTYKIVRPSGEDASKTLSEGEHNFISFLYFYYLCFGSHNKTGLESKKVIVIDDPISSMDSNVLFIVSTLVKNIIRNCKDNQKGINQVIILTHNVYFYKEITFWGNKDALPPTQTGYYILRKVEEETTIQEYETNPIKTSYELLWKELKSETIGSANILMNVMRRILEHYFMVIGGINYEKCINEMDGTDKIICKALISFINDGSHSVFEDLIFAPDDGDIENYKRVFKLVFKKLGHIDHYNMMMSKI